MERYFSVTKSRTTHDTGGNDKSATKDDSSRVPTSRSDTRYKPYTANKEARNKKSQSLPEDVTPSASTVTKLLLKTLGDEANPITHSDIGLRSDHVVSMAGGHQHSEERRHRIYNEERTRKLAAQSEEAKSASGSGNGLLRSVKVYINGFLAGTTDIEMKRIVTEAGGLILPTASGATHILTSQPLSGSKTQKILTKKSRAPVHVVKPEWVFDSIKAGKRRSERPYLVITNTTTNKLHEMWQK
ncbi:hypothetical protein V5O48_004914 [Marasmius crinis-equi]|uniref:BRCT domain-containing protein n=1 Tax=Marasmius crinis-equi TaxID=585013 RepID=A0ABR3FNV9_9AGAR